MHLIYLVQYFRPEKASGGDMVVDLLDGFAAGVRMSSHRHRHVMSRKKNAAFTVQIKKLSS